MHSEIDIVIPLGKGSFWGDNEELRHCLRGVEMYLSGVRNVVIVGELPKWITNVIHITATDDKGVAWRDRNIYRKIVLAVNDERVSDDFLFMNDDHFLTKSFHAATFPYYYREYDMIETINKMFKNISWRTVVSNTRNFLLKNNYDVKMFDTHCPIVYNRWRFGALQKADWDIPHGYGIKSLYANMNHIEGIYQPDNKIFSSEDNHKRIMGKINRYPFFSTDFISPPHQKAQREIIQSIYSKKSKYEK
jgi:hypothetical protein